MARPFIFNTPIGISGYSGFSGYSGVQPLSATSIDVPTASAVTINWATSNTHYIALSSSLSAVSFTGATDGQSILVAITNPSTYSLTWSATALSAIIWNGGTASRQTTGTNAIPKTDVYGFQYVQGSYYGYALQNLYYTPAALGPVAATGGTLTTANGYNQWTFNSSSTWTVTSPGIVYYAIVAGGGGSGGGSTSGGSGSGGVITGILPVSVGTYSVIVGAGGVAGSNSTTLGGNGNISSLAGLSAVGGGGSNGSGTGSYGGSGGAPSYNNASGAGPGIAGQGWAGGVGTTSSPYPAGGGGGAGGIGYNGTGSTGGNGGPGLSIYLPASGVSTYVGGGGGAGATGYGASAGSGGIGGGASGNNNGNGGANGVANTGGGAGGGNGGYSPFNGSLGGSGVVYIWSPISTPTKTPYVNYLVVAGGGAGGGYDGAGGGAGGLLTGTTQVSSGVTYTVTVGSGGAGTGVAGNQGSNSGLSATTFTIVASGGGGGSDAVGHPGGPGGSGSGSFPGTLGQGNAGGSGSTGAPYLQGGGGGYGFVGGNAGTGSGSYAGSGGDGGTFGIANGTGQNWSYYMSSSQGNTFTVPTGAFNSTSTNWTIECWMFTQNWTQNQGIITASGQGNSLGLFVVSSTGHIQISNWGSPTWDTGIVLPIGSWHHIAAVRSGSTVTVYLDGVSSGSTTTGSYSFSFTNPTAWSICGWGGTGGGVNGYISNLRVNSSNAVYTSNFTPSVSALSAIAGTTLLTCQSPAFIDNSSNNYTLTVTGTPSIASQNPFGISYAGGGGAGNNSQGGTGGVACNVSWAAGMGGGGTGGASGNGNPATVNTGGGGGGAYAGSSGGSGGSGVVILSYPSTYSLASTTGSPTLTTANGNNIYKFTASGSITF